MDRYHPVRFAETTRLLTETSSADVSGRLELLRDVVDNWALLHGAFFDVAELPELDGSVDGEGVAKFFADHDAVYIHFGEEASLDIDDGAGGFIDGMYLSRQTSAEGEEGFLILVVGAERNRHETTAEDVAKIAAGWMPFDETIEEGLARGGLVGDPAIADSGAMSAWAAVFDRAMARVLVASARSRTPEVGPRLH